MSYLVYRNPFITDHILIVISTEENIMTINMAESTDHNMSLKSNIGLTFGLNNVHK